MATRKFILIATIVMALLVVSCAPEALDKTGYVSFSASRSRDVMASIAYPSPESLMWTVGAVKTSRGSKAGQGEYDEVLLTDEIGPFAVGTWTFTLDGYDGTTLVYHGEVETTIAEGNNSIGISVTPVGETGTIVFAGCNVPANATGVYIDLDGERIVGMGNQYMSERADGMYDMPERETEASVGIHDITVTYNGTNTSETFKVRVAAGLVTTVSFGIFEGKLMFNVTVEKVEALVE